MNDLLFAINPRVVGKDLKALRFHNDGFKNVVDVLDGETIFDLIAGHGFATTSILKEDGNREGSNVLGAKVVQLDFDNTWDIEGAMKHPLYKDYCIGIYTTSSDGKNQVPIAENERYKLDPLHVSIIESRVGQPQIRFRMVFIVENMICENDIKSFYTGLFKSFPLADDSCKDSARLFFGSKNARIIIINSNARPMEAEMIDTFIKEGSKGSVTSKNSGIYTSTDFISLKSKIFYDNHMIKMAGGNVTDCESLVISLLEGYENRQPCFSVFRNEKNPSSFVQKTKFGDLRFYDSASNESFIYKSLRKN